VNKEASHYLRSFGGHKIGNIIFLLPLVIQYYALCGMLQTLIISPAVVYNALNPQLNA
jgi:hypothetical protein